MSTQSFTSQQTAAPTSQRAEMEQDQLSNTFDDRRAETAAQAKMLADIENSPKTLAQRKEHEQIFGSDNTTQLMPEEEELMQGKFENPAQLMSEEEELMQGKFTNSSPIQQKSENGLPQDVNSKLESTLGADFSGVNIHTNSAQAKQMNARAYAQGTDVHFAPGQFKPDTSEGQKLIGHEFTHIVQQAAGKVKPTTEVNGMAVNDDKGLEGEADRMGDLVARG